MAEPRTRKGPRPTHSRPTVATTAVRVADAEGLAAVTMRRLGHELGTGGASLYRYVASRDDLLDLMVDAVSAELELTADPTDDWVGDLVAFAEQLRVLHRRHRWLADVRQEASTPGPHVVDHLEHGLRLLAPVAAPVRAKLEAIAILTGVVTLFSQQEARSTALTLSVDPARSPRLSAALGNAVPDPRPQPDLFARVVGGAVRGVLEPPPA
jgi:AcrR family transcriptional regulator